MLANVTAAAPSHVLPQDRMVPSDHGKMLVLERYRGVYGGALETAGIVGGRGFRDRSLSAETRTFFRLIPQSNDFLKCVLYPWIDCAAQAPI
jgi:hypothetical protein